MLQCLPRLLFILPRSGPVSDPPGHMAKSVGAGSELDS